jgi:hypothetical protein
VISADVSEVHNHYWRSDIQGKELTIAGNIFTTYDLNSGDATIRMTHELPRSYGHSQIKRANKNLQQKDSKDMCLAITASS